MLRYINIWWLLGKQSTKTAFDSRFGAVLFVIGKATRFALFLFFVLLIASKVEYIAGYSLWQMILFFATFNLLDTIVQLFFREVYRFRRNVVTGDFDYTLTKPISPLFRSLLGGVDILDIPIFFISIFLLIFSMMQVENITLVSIAGFVLLMVNALLIATAFHIFVLALGILTTEVDNALWLYRDITQMGRVPVDIYKEPLRGLITFVVPVGIMVTFPAKALMGLITFSTILISLILGGIFFYSSILLWLFALKRYASASS